MRRVRRPGSGARARSRRALAWGGRPCSCRPLHATLGADAQYLRERFDHAFPALRRLPLSERISDAIVLRSGPYAPALQIACALETDDASVVRQLCDTHEMDTESVNRALLRLLSELHVERPRPGQPTGSR